MCPSEELGLVNWASLARGKQRGWIGLMERKDRWIKVFGPKDKDGSTPPTLRQTDEPLFICVCVVLIFQNHRVV